MSSFTKPLDFRWRGVRQFELLADFEYLGVNPVTKYMVWAAVRLFGGSAWV